MRIAAHPERRTTVGRPIQLLPLSDDITTIRDDEHGVLVHVILPTTRIMAGTMP